MTPVYAPVTAKKIAAAARKAVIIFVLSAAAFAAICTLFCVLTALGFVNAYLGCALNVLITVPFIWYGYLYFKVYAVEAFARYNFVKSLENALPSIVTDRLVSKTDCGKYEVLSFERAGALKKDKISGCEFFEGHVYSLKTVRDAVVEYEDLTV